MNTPSIKFAGLALAVLASTALLAHADNDYLSEIFGDQPKPGASPTPRVKKPADHCDEALTRGARDVAGPRGPGSSLVLTQTSDPVEDMFMNKPIEVSRLRLADDSDENRLAQYETMREYAREVARLVLETPSYLGDEDAQIRLQQLLQDSIGKLPENSMLRIEEILDANLSSLTEPNQKPRYRKDADNALAELTRVITSYRKNGLDVNTLANGASKLARIPFLGRPFKDLDVVLRERFQTVKDAIRVNDEVLAGAVAEMLIRHAQMREARLECRALERYLELALAITEEVGRLVGEFIDSTDPTEEQRARFQKIVQTPLANAEMFIHRNRTAVMTAYHQFALLMDGNLDLIGIVSNVRGTAKLSISVFGAGRIIANEQQTTMNMARDTIMAVDDLQKQTIEQIRRQGVQIRSFPEDIIKSTGQMIGQLDVLLAELQFALESQGVMLGRLGRANKIFKDKLEEARVKGAQYDLVRAMDGLVDKIAARGSKRVERDVKVP